MRAAPSQGVAALRAALLDVLPLTVESTAMSRVWVSFWDAALGSLRDVTAPPEPDLPGSHLPGPSQ